MTDKGILVLQNCMDLDKCAPGPCGETYPTAANDATVTMNIKVEEVSDIEVEDECPVPMTFVGIKAEHEVRCMSACPLLACFTHNKKYPSHVACMWEKGTACKYANFEPESLELREQLRNCVDGRNGGFV
jgi:hypothetical protein